MKKLTSEHPLAIKVEKAEAFLNELGLRIVRSYKGISIKDCDTDIEADYVDMEDGRPTDEFPSHWETKLVIEN